MSSARDDLVLCFPFEPKSFRTPLLAWYEAQNRSLPWRALWKAHRDPYHIWVSEIMLQQTVIKAVLPVYDRFLQRFPSIHELAAAEEADVREAVRGLGYYRRFRMMHEAAQLLAKRSQATTKRLVIWPRTFDGWKELPGIGDYTAAAISSIAFSYPAAVVDGNVERVFCRLLDIREAPNQPRLKKSFKALAQEFLDQEHAGDFNQALMELGQTVCTISTPRCGTCPLAKGCLAEQRGSQRLAPAPKTKVSPIDTALRLGILFREDKKNLFIGFHERSPQARFLKGTAGFFTLVGQQADAYAGDGWSHSKLEQSLARTEPSASVRHSITHHRIRADVVALDVTQRQGLSHAVSEWVPAQDVERRLVSNLDRKAWEAFMQQRQGLPLPLERLFVEH